MINFFINLSPVYQALIAGIFTWFVTLLGASLVFFFKKINNFIMDLTMGFSAGIMIAASIFSLIIPALNMKNNCFLPNYLIVSIGIILGTFLILGGSFIYDFLNNFNNKNIGDSKKRSFLLISSITIHNIPEGFILGCAFASIKYNSSITLISAVMLTIGIAIQNFPEGCAISLPLRREGYSLSKAFFIGQLSAIVEPISAVVGALLVIKIKSLLPIFLAVASGAMFYVCFEELIPESQRNSKSIATISTILGFIIMMVLDVALG